MSRAARELRLLLNDYLTRSRMKPMPGFFMRGEIDVKHERGRIRSDEDQCYCNDCAKRVHGELQKVVGEKAARDHEIAPADLDGVDDAAVCFECACPLDYRLTPAGAKRSIEHYESEPLGNDDLAPQDAFHIVRIIEAAPEDPAAIALAEEALRVMPPPPPAPAGMPAASNRKPVPRR